MLAPLSNYLGGGAWPPLAPSLPTPKFYTCCLYEGELGSVGAAISIPIFGSEAKQIVF